MKVKSDFVQKRQKTQKSVYFSSTRVFDQKRQKNQVKMAQKVENRFLQRVKVLKKLLTFYSSSDCH